MKRIVIFLIAIMLLLSLVACDTGNDPALSDSDVTDGSLEGDSTTVNPADIDLGAILSGNGQSDVIYGKLDESTKQAIIAEAKLEGVDVSFGADGSMTVVDTDGTTVVQKPDGTWVIRDADGGEGQVGGNWPDNEYTRLVPKPSLAVQAAYVDGEGFFVSFTNATVDQLKDYVQQVKAAGYTIQESIEEQEVMGEVMYTFTAANAEGYTVEIFSAMGTSGMTISKP